MHRRHAVALLATISLAACSTPDATSPISPLGTLALPIESNRAAVGGVFTQTNDAAGNAVVAYDRLANGSLVYVGTVPTGGLGIGGVSDPLVSQFALTLGRDARFLFVVNAGSNSVSSFRVNKGHLTLVSTTPTGGVLPISVAASARTLYVLNGGSNTITGLDIAANGTLSPRADIVAPLSAGATGAAAVRLSRDGRFLTVTARTSNSLDTYVVAPNGTLGGLITNVSAGLVPFGFDYTSRGQLVVSEAGSGSASSYLQRSNGSLDLQTAAAPTLQRAPCWVIVNPAGTFAYTANAGSATLTGFSIDRRGKLALVTATGISADLGASSQPLDLDMSRDGRFLYVFKNGTGTIHGFSVDRNGLLESRGEVSQGIAVRAGYQGLAAF